MFLPCLSEDPISLQQFLHLQKNIRKIELIGIILIIILGTFNFISIGSTETILGDSSFPAEENDYFIWKCINSTDSKHNIGDLTRFTVEKIYNETFNGVHSLIVNYTIENYEFIKGLVDGGLDISANDKVFPSKERLDGEHLKENVKLMITKVKEKLK